MIATYGLRPHEIFAINVENFIDLSNTLHALTLDESITDGLKTGGRTIFPLPIEWVDRFNLKNVRIPKLVKAHLDAKFENRSRTISRVFLRRNMSFQPYDLRHTYAVRGHVMGIPLKEMADNMGHSIDMHTKTYQKYMTLDHRRIVYQKAIDRFQNIKNEQTELEQVKAENTLLKIEVENLKSENESIRALLTQRQISNLLSK